MTNFGINSTEGRERIVGVAISPGAAASSVLTADGAGGTSWAAGGGGSQPGVRRVLGPFVFYTGWSQTLDYSQLPNAPNGGTMKISYDDEETTAVAWDAGDVTVQAALDALPSLTGKVTVQGTIGQPGFRILLDQSIIAPFRLVISDDQLTFDAAPLAFTPEFTGVGETEVELFQTTPGDWILDRFFHLPAEASPNGLTTWLEDDDDFVGPVVDLTGREDNTFLPNFGGNDSTGGAVTDQLQNYSDQAAAMPVPCLVSTMLKWCVGQTPLSNGAFAIYMCLEVATPVMPS